MISNLLFPRSKFSRYAPVAAYALFIFILSSIPGYRYPDIHVRFADKYVHFLLYVPFGALILRALILPDLTAARAIGAIVLGALYGASDEFHQRFTPARSCDINDWIVDVIAVSVGVAAWILIERALLRSREPNS